MLGVAHFLTLLGGKHVMMQRFETKEVFRLMRKDASIPLGSCPSWPLALVNAQPQLQLEQPAGACYPERRLRHVIREVKKNRLRMLSGTG